MTGEVHTHRGCTKVGKGWAYPFCKSSSSSPTCRKIVGVNKHVNGDASFILVRAVLDKSKFSLTASFLYHRERRRNEGRVEDVLDLSACVRSSHSAQRDLFTGVVGYEVHVFDPVFVIWWARSIAKR